MENTSTQFEITAIKTPEQSKKSGLFSMITEDIRCALKRDPAARNWFEVLMLYSGLHAIWFYRGSHWLWQHNFKFLARGLSQVIRWITGVEIHPGAVIGHRFFIDHGMGVVIGETSEIGNDVTMYHGVTLGGISLNTGKRHPTLKDNIVVGSGAKILGAIEIGAGSRIGANAVVVKSVPPDSVVVGIPGQVINHGSHQTRETPDIHHDQLPDTLGQALQHMKKRLEYLEENLPVNEQSSPKLMRKEFRSD